MDVASLISKLHPLERVVLPLLKENKELSEIVKISKLQEIEVMRAFQWLENKNLLKIDKKKIVWINLDKNGLLYKKEGLPEKIFLSVLDDNFKALNIISKKSKLSREEINACIGLLKRRSAVDVKKEGETLYLKITEAGKKLLNSRSNEEKFLEKTFPIDASTIKEAEQLLIKELRSRKEFIKVEERNLVFVELTELGKELANLKLEGEVINRLTKEMLRTGSWKNKQFRSYDIEINVPKKYPGKKHFVNQAIEYAKHVWIEMGFKEMTGDFVNTSFWNFDALFTAQDHPIRELQDTFYIGGEAEKGKLPSQELVRKLKEVHENGGNTGSKGWGYKWEENEAKKNVLRTHTTVMTPKKLAQLSPKDLPAKYFGLGKVFRNEALDWSHLFEFNQTEGIVIDEKANFRHLLGYLKQFFKKMGYPKARFRPAFFPYTEPSVEIDVWHPVHNKWFELGGAGMLRPEVVVPLLGKDVPVLAWGPGLDRIILDYYNITDIRELYKNDIKQLKESKVWLK